MYGKHFHQKMMSLLYGLKEFVSFKLKPMKFNINGIKFLVRPANVYGPFDNFDTDNAMVIPSLIKKSIDSDELKVWGDGTPIRDFIYSEDVARGMILASKKY